MVRLVYCAKLQKELPGLDYAPIPGPLGERIYQEISQEAWKLWVSHSTMVINENRLNPSDPKAQEVLLAQLEKFLFGGGVEAPAGFVPIKEK